VVVSMLVQLVQLVQLHFPRVRSARDERGASLVEYALLLALIALVCVGALQLLGGDVSTRLSGVGNSLSSGS
jgi:pilus assembly protein Flp/PilA